MATIVLRSVKGSPLTIQEADDNFNNLNSELGLKLDAANYTAADVLSKLLTVDGHGSGVDADFVDGRESSALNTPNSMVHRDGSGNFAAGTITANLTGNVTGNVTGNLIGTVTGNASNVSGVVAIVNGGTGATSAAAARTALGLGTMSQQNSSAVSITGGTITGITDLTIADGGTGASTATQARTNLGLVIGSDIQPFSNELTALSAITGTGLQVRTGSATFAQRTIAVGGNGLSITNADGISGNPTISLSTSASVQLSGLTLNTLSVSGTSTLAGVTCGNITSSGSITAVGNITGYFSDDRLKIKLGRIEGALDKLCALEGFYFEANQTAQDLGYTAKKEVGVSAQSVQAVLPEVVGPAPIDPQYLTVDYARMVPLIIEAIKEIREEIRSLK